MTVERASEIVNFVRQNQPVVTGFGNEDLMEFDLSIVESEEFSDDSNHSTYSKLSSKV